MRNSVLLLVGLLTAACSTATRDLQGETLPAEFPPTTFREAQYVDSRGCAFIRAGFDGNVTWVPRVSRDRRPVCGLQPSLPETAAEPDV